MNKASATNSPKLSKTEKMLLIARNYWDYTAQPIVFVAPTMAIAADIQNRFFRLIESCCDGPENPRRVRCFSLHEPDELKGFRGTQNTAFFFDHTCFERSDLLEAAGKLVNAIREDGFGEVVTPCIAERVPCPWGREDGPEAFIAATKGEAEKPAFCEKSILFLEPQDSIAATRMREIHDLLAKQFEAHMQSRHMQSGLTSVSTAKPPIGLKPRREVDKLRINDILAAMSASNATDKAIPEEWMDELSDLVWRERDRLGVIAEDSQPPIRVRFKE
jgi:hypothetical protein